MTADADGPETRRVEQAVRQALQAAGSLPGGQVGPYRILDRIGEGGMGVVYRAEFPQDNLVLPVALKVLHGGIHGETSRRRFEFEVQALAAMDHECIAKVHGAGVTDRGEPYLAMELVHGVDLGTFCDRHRLSIEARIRLFQRICAGVDHAHRKLVIHRDLKPANVLVVDRDGEPVPKIIDFGIARASDRAAHGGDLVTADGQVGGTREYMSPEQAAGRPQAIDTRTDVYSLGVMLYELLTGELPFASARLRTLSWGEFERVVRDESPPRPSHRLTTQSPAATECARRCGTTTESLGRELRTDLDWIVLAAMAKEPDRRYGSAAELAADLERYLRREPVLAGPPTIAYRLRKLLQRHRLPVTAAAIVLLCAFAALWLGLEAKASSSLAAARQEHVDQVLFVVKADELRRAVVEDALVETPENLPALERWLREVDDGVAALAGPAGDDSEYLLAARERIEGWLRSRGFDDPQGGWIGRIRRGRDWAAQVRKLSCDDHAAAWQRCRQRVADRPGYGGLDLQPQTGLVPLGPDPDSGLEEFAFLRSGTVPQRDPASARLMLEDGSAIVLVLLPGGPFVIGAQASDPHGARFDPAAAANEGPPVAVQLEPFFLGKHEITQAQWMRLGDGDNPSLHHPGMSPPAPPELGRVTLSHPVENVYWHQAWHLMTRMGLTLPTEAQWEYGARGGTDSIWFTGDDRETLRAHDGLPVAANIADGTAGQFEYFRKDVIDWIEFEDGHVVHCPIGTLRANAFGLHEVIGNVREWTLDEPGSYDDGVENGTGRLLGKAADRRVCRGGSWTEPLRSCRVSHRNTTLLTHRQGNIGLRAARRLDR
ncbi:MAG: SUMF1/EgtB/PvdO family nonheme iron enzyme [Planctomycetes bacterium]|nr:SUMF1/EgtB/PvdO family nonheme iron enzyme [Planctomycetota bacterium]